MIYLAPTASRLARPGGTVGALAPAVEAGMLSDFVTTHRTELIVRCRARVAARMAPRATEHELEHGIPAFLDELAVSLRAHLAPGPESTARALAYGGDLLRQGFSVAQVVHDYGDVCQSITEMALECDAPISTSDFKALNLCLDDAIASAVTGYSDQRERDLVEEVRVRSDEDLGVLAHELRNLLGTASLACESLRSGSVGINGSTGAVLERSLAGLRQLVDQPLAAVRLHAGIEARTRVEIARVIEDAEVGAMMDAKKRGHQLTVEIGDAGAAAIGDPQILASIVTNLVQNALKYSRPHTHIIMRSSRTAEMARIEVEDECGGLPAGRAEALFRPFAQGSQDTSGLGLGLSICRRGAEAMGGTLTVRDIPGRGCVFTLALPLAPARV